MATTIGIRSVPHAKARRAWREVRQGFRHAPTSLLYGVLGLIGVIMWGFMHLPLGARIKAGLVYAVAGAIGLCTLGWQQIHGSVRSS